MFFDIQRANMTKRISAWLLDAILMMVAVTGFAFLVSAIVRYDDKFAELNGYYAAIEQEYGINTGISEEELLALSEEEMAAYRKADEALSANQDYLRCTEMLFYLSFLILSMSFLLGYALLEFAIPRYAGNGQTIGKKVFGLAVMHTDQTKVSTLSMAIRTFLGKYTIETMVPALILIMIYFGTIGIIGTIVILLLIILQLVVLIKTPTTSAIHDLISGCVVVDLKSQMIFESAEAKEQYKNKLEQNEKKRDL